LAGTFVRWEDWLELVVLATKLVYDMCAGGTTTQRPLCVTIVINACVRRSCSN
jgi:hypothetical protein